jgi:hypothetical protein
MVENKFSGPKIYKRDLPRVLVDEKDAMVLVQILQDNEIRPQKSNVDFNFCRNVS